MNVLVTGCAGYVGSVLVRELLAHGHAVRGIDILYFGDRSLEEVRAHPRFEFLRGDIRRPDDRRRAVEGVDAVVNLAAIVGDPACARQPELAEETNGLAARGLFDLCRASGHVRRFVSASTCSNYGKMSSADGFVDEQAPLSPVSLYARQKVRFEEYLLGSGRTPGFAPVSLRFATAYGLSPRMRFDLTVNEFTRELTLGRELVVFGEQFWRPYCHTRDLAAACRRALEADAGLVDHQVFNVGDTAENYQKQTLVALIRERIPEARVRFVHRDEDPRDYRVRFEKINRVLGFRAEWTVPRGIDEIRDAIREGRIADPDEKIMCNVRS